MLHRSQGSVATYVPSRCLSGFCRHLWQRLGINGQWRCQWRWPCPAPVTPNDQTGFVSRQYTIAPSQQCVSKEHSAKAVSKQVRSKVRSNIPTGEKGFKWLRRSGPALFAGCLHDHGRATVGEALTVARTSHQPWAECETGQTCSKVDGTCHTLTRGNSRGSIPARGPPPRRWRCDQRSMGPQRARPLLVQARARAPRAPVPRGARQG